MDDLICDNARVKKRFRIPFRRFVAIGCVMALPLTLSACSGDVGSDFPTSMPDTEITHSPLGKSAVPSVTDDSPHGKAVRAVDAMTLDERIGQLVMAPLPAGSDPSTLRDLIVDQHVGSVLIIGNWNSGTTGVSAATSELQSYAPSNNRLLMTTDQEGGSVQHLSGNGFDTMPSATDQGTMDTAQLRQSSATWGAQLKSAGINVDLAPVVVGMIV